jgi:membrane-anchored protein YejM (alkaline phosphatase superfamily)
MVKENKKENKKVKRKITWLFFYTISALMSIYVHFGD